LRICSLHRLRDRLLADGAVSTTPMSLPLELSGALSKERNTVVAESQLSTFSCPQSTAKLLCSCRTFSDPINPSVNGHPNMLRIMIAILLRRSLGFPASTTDRDESADERFFSRKLD
jgi:hypothetical protein